MLTDYTSYAAVRAVLGVSSDEIEDTVIALPMYEIMLVEDLLDLNPSMNDDYSVVRVIASKTAIEARFAQIVQTYASYQVAYTLLGAAPMFAPKDIKDGKAGVARVADPFQPLQASIAQALSYIRIKLLSSYEAYAPAELAPQAISRDFLTSTGLSLDPVTG